MKICYNNLYAGKVPALQLVVRNTSFLQYVLLFCNVRYLSSDLIFVPCSFFFLGLRNGPGSGTRLVYSSTFFPLGICVNFANFVLNCPIITDCYFENCIEITIVGE